MAEILARHTQLPVLQVMAGLALQAGQSTSPAPASR